MSIKKSVKSESKKIIKPKKLRVGIQSITGCAGCQLSIYFLGETLLEFLNHIDLVAAPMIKGANDDKGYDILFVEGSVSSKEDLENLLKWRKQAKILIALGACATHGSIQSMKHNADEKEEKEIEKAAYDNFPSEKRLSPITAVPLHKHVKVDFKIPGCPVYSKDVADTIKQVLLGRKLRFYDKPVCHECALKENHCLLDQGIPCLGPLTNGSCKALCPDFNHPCTGCRGLLDDANFSSGKQMLIDKGFDPVKLIHKMAKYNTLEFMETEEKSRQKLETQKEK